MKKLLIVAGLLLTATFCHATTRFVSPAGGGSAPCTTGPPYCSLATGLSLTTAPGDILTFKDGTYNACIATTATGTSSAHISYQAEHSLGAKIVCDGSSTPAGHNAVWANGTSSSTRVGDYVEIIGFEITTSPAINTCDGLITFGAFNLIKGNYVHDIIPNLASACSTGGGEGISLAYNGNAPTAAHDSVVDSNIVDNIGRGDDGVVGHVCVTTHGIYPATPRQTITNNLISRACGWGIHFNHNVYQEVAAGNVVINNYRGGILVSSANGFTDDNTAVIDNVVADNGLPGVGHYGIEEDYGATGTNNVYRNNSGWGNTPTTGCLNPPAGVTNCFYHFANGGRTVTGTQQTGSDSNFFVNYTGNSKTGNYQLKAGSPGINSGVTGPCAVSPGLTPCVPSADFSGAARPASGAQDIGAYVFASAGTPGVSFNPNPLAFGSVPVSSSSTLTDVLTNSGTVNLTFSTATISGTNASSFSIVSTTCSSPLASLATCNYVIKATPQAAGALTANLTLNDNAAGSPHQLPLTVTGGSGAVTFTPSSLAFGVVAPGSTSAVLATTVANTGNVSFQVQAASFTGTNAGDFTFGGTGTCAAGQNLTPGQSCTLSAKFIPTATGARSATLSAPTSLSPTPNSIPLTGTGGAPVVSLTPSSGACGSRQISTSGTCQAFTLTNTGNIDLTGIAISITGANPTSFSQTNTCPANAILTSSSSCTITTFFSPTTSGALAATLSVASNATSSPNTAPLTGTGTAPPTIALAPQSVNYGSIRVGTPSTTGIVVTNTGGVAVTISSISTASPFSQTNNCPASLGAGLNCTVNVTATPVTTGTVNGTLTITDSANGSPHTASLSVTGIAPVVTLTPASIAFGNQPLNTASAVQNYTLSNTGTASLTFSVALAGASPSDYVLGALGCTSPLPVGQNCLIPVQFKPANLGSRTAILQVTDNASGSPHTSTMSGTGIALTPAVCLSTSSVAFGNQPVNTTSGSLPITVTNCGQANLNVSSVPPTITNIDQYPSPGFTSASCTPQSVGGIWCGKQDAGIPMGTATGSTALVTTPSTSGHARQFVANISGSAGFRFSSYLGPTILNTTSTHFTYHTHVRVDDATQASHFEFDLYQGLLNGDTIIYGVQCSFLSGKWEYTTALNPTTSQWTASNLSCSAATFPANTYIDLIFAYHRDLSGNVTYESVTINGVTSNFTGAVGNSEFTIGFLPIGLGIVNFQIDGLAGATTTTAYLDGLSIAGATPTSPFAQTNNCVGTPVVPSGTCTINATFSPTVPGSVAGQLVLNSDASSSPDIVQLSGSGTQTGATLTPSSLAFGSVIQNQSRLMTMTLANTGNTSLTILPPTITGGAASSYTGGTACGASLAPGATCQEQVTFVPQSAGSLSATFNQPFGNGVATITAPLSGTGVALTPAVTLVPTSMDFGNVTTGVTSASKTVQLTNSGNATLNITSITLTGSNAGDYSLTSHCGATLAAGSPCTVDVTVTPGGTGARTANLHFIDDAADTPQNVTLTTNGVAAPAPKVSLSTASLAFSPPSIQTGTTSASQSITVANMGNASLVVSSVTLTGSNPGDYSETNNCTTVLAGNSCAVTVNFSPTAAGSRTANVSIASNAASSPDTVTLSGTGFVGTPNLVLAVTNINFNNQTVGTTSAPAAFTITNNGLASASGVVISTSGDFAETDNCGTSINTGVTCTVMVTFTPLVLCGQTDPNNPAICISNVHLGQVSVVSNTSNSPQTVNLQGTAIPVPPPPGPIIMSMGGKTKVGGKVHLGSH